MKCSKCGREHPEMIPFRKTAIHVVQGEKGGMTEKVTTWEGMAPYVCVQIDAAMRAALDKAFESGKVVKR